MQPIEIITKASWGAIIGDIVGSRFEWDNIKTKNFELFTDKCSFTDDSVLTIAIYKALVSTYPDRINLVMATVCFLKDFTLANPDKGYGLRFWNWANSKEKEPYDSYGNGAAMRVSGAGLMAHYIEEAKKLSEYVTGVTHNHPEGLKGAEATAVAIYLAKSGKSKEEIKEYIVTNYYPIDFTLDEIRANYKFNGSCQGTVPQALEAFFESTSFEDAIRNAVSIGGDSDTIAAITGSIAGTYYEIPDEMIVKAKSYLTPELLEVVKKFRDLQKEWNINSI